jgi:hypothetical protein
MILLLSSKNIHLLRVGLDIKRWRWVIDVYDRKQVTSYGILNFTIYSALFSVGVTA